MPIPTNLFTPTFQRQHLGWLFVGILAIMVYLATLAMALQTTLSSTGLSWDRVQKGRFTIELPPSEKAAAQTGQILTLLAAMPEIQKIEPLTNDDAERLLKPWINAPALLKTLPLPALIDIYVKDKTTLSSKTLQTRLASIAPEARVEAHAEWLHQLGRVIHALTALGWGLFLLTGLALVIAVNLICRAALAVEEKTLELLHIMGATDKAIADIFAVHARTIAWPAAVIGFSMALLTLGGLGLMIHSFWIVDITPSARWIWPALSLFTVPCLAVLVSVLTARSSVLTLLRQEP